MKCLQCTNTFDSGSDPTAKQLLVCNNNCYHWFHKDNYRNCLTAWVTNQSKLHTVVVPAQDNLTLDEFKKLDWSQVTHEIKCPNEGCDGKITMMKTFHYIIKNKLRGRFHCRSTEMEEIYDIQMREWNDWHNTWKRYINSQIIHKKKHNLALKIVPRVDRWNYKQALQRWNQGIWYRNYMNIRDKALIAKYRLLYQEALETMGNPH